MRCIKPSWWVTGFPPSAAGRVSGEASWESSLGEEGCSPQSRSSFTVVEEADIIVITVIVKYLSERLP